MHFLSRPLVRAPDHRGGGRVGIKHRVFFCEGWWVRHDDTVLGALGARLGVIFDSEVQLRKSTLMEVFTMVSPVTSLQVTSS